MWALAAAAIRSTTSRCLYLPSTSSGDTLLAASKTMYYNFNSQQFRGRKRFRKAGLSKAQKVERKLKREEKLKHAMANSFAERLKRTLASKSHSSSSDYPGRFDPESDAKLPPLSPTSNVFIRRLVQAQHFTVSEALAMHRESQHPTMFNNPNAKVRLRLELNMSSEKKGRPIANSKNIVPVPFQFHHGEKRSIIAFATDAQRRDTAIEAGAEVALGADMVKKIIKGQFNTDDYDFCVAHTDIIKALMPLRAVLKERFPSKINGGLGSDLVDLIDKFKNGVKYDIRSDTIFSQWGIADMVIARLEMPDDQIEANIISAIESVCSHRNPALGPFINRACLMLIGSREYFPLNIDQWVPVASAEEIEKMQEKLANRDKRKPAKKVVAPTLADDDDEKPSKTIAAAPKLEEEEEEEEEIDQQQQHEEGAKL